MPKCGWTKWIAAGFRVWTPQGKAKPAANTVELHLQTSHLGNGLALQQRCIQKTLPKRCHITRVCKHSSMPSNATQSPSTLVVDFTDDAPPTPFAKFSGGNILRGLKRGSWLEVGTQSQRFGDTLINRLVERTPR